MNPEPISPGKARFPPTHWSVVLAAGSPDKSAGLAALSQICGAYWHPLYAFARKLGHPPADAQDLTQGFFESLLERPFLGRADAAKGRFRSFLLGVQPGHWHEGRPGPPAIGLPHSSGLLDTFTPRG